LREGTLVGAQIFEASLLRPCGPTSVSSRGQDCGDGSAFFGGAAGCRESFSRGNAHNLGCRSVVTVKV